MIKSGSKTRRVETRKETFVFDGQSENRYITEAGDVIHGTAAHPDGEQKFDLLAGYRLHVCKMKGE
jgi:hypothetical protein